MTDSADCLTVRRISFILFQRSKPHYLEPKLATVFIRYTRTRKQSPRRSAGAAGLGHGFRGFFIEIMSNGTKPKIAVIDGMGGNIGHQIVSQLRQELPAEVEILVFGTNSAATANMMKARASRGCAWWALPASRCPT